MKAVEKLIEAIRTERNLDRRSSVFEIHYSARDGTVALTGHTTEDEAVIELLARVRALPNVKEAIDEIVRLPGQIEAAERNALVRVAVAPVYQEPRIPSSQITEIVLGTRVELLSHENAWWRIRSEDGYIGWVHSGYLLTGPVEWARAWERGGEGESVVSLGATLVDNDGNVLAQLPWGARLIRYSHDTFELPDGSRGLLGDGEIVAVDRLYDRFPPRGDSVTRTARRWLGASYLWGGVTMAGVDCSGLAQQVFWMHGVALPRDSDLQARVGHAIEPGDDFAGVRTGDLLFFADTPERVTHVAISLGESRIIHASLSNACVAINDLLAENPLEQRLRQVFVGVRRLLPD